MYVEHLYDTLVSTVLGSALGFSLGTAEALSRKFDPAKVAAAAKGYKAK